MLWLLFSPQGSPDGCSCGTGNQARLTIVALVNPVAQETRIAKPPSRQHKVDSQVDLAFPWDPRGFTGVQETEVRGDQAVVGCSRRMQKRGVCAPVRYDFLDKCLNSTTSQLVVTFWSVHVAVFCVACGSRSSLIAVCCPKQHPGRQAETCRSVENSIAPSSPLLVAVCADSASASGHRSQSSCADTET